MISWKKFYIKCMGTLKVTSQHIWIYWIEFYSNSFAQNFAQILPTYVKKEIPQMVTSSSGLQEPTTVCYCRQGTSPSYFSYHLQFSCYYIKKKITFLLFEIKALSWSSTYHILYKYKKIIKIWQFAGGCYYWVLFCKQH